MRQALASLIVVALVHGLAFSQEPREIQIRVLDYRTGLPVGGRKVGLSVSRENEDRAWLVAKTGKDGVASFPIGVPVPQVLHIDPEGGSLANWSCTRSDATLDTLSGVLDLRNFRSIAAWMGREVRESSFL
jgi:hypothetical protein